jgi:hypothetical protein
MRSSAIPPEQIFRVEVLVGGEFDLTGAVEMSLEEIAENLNHKGIRTPHGSATWSATSVRKAFVS